MKKRRSGLVYKNTSSKNTAAIACILFCIVTSCSRDKIPRDYDLNGVLLFEEQSRFERGYLPNLVAYNPQTDERFVLVRDRLKNVHPSWVASGDSIVFESKRVRSDGAPSHLYVLNTRTTIITPLHEGMDVSLSTGWHTSYRSPALNNSSKRVYYYTSSCKCLLATSLVDKSVDSTGIATNPVARMFWSDDGRYLTINSMILSLTSPKDIITVYDAVSYAPVVEFSRENWVYTAGDIYNGVLIYRMYERKRGSTIYVRSYNLETGEDESLFESDSRIYDQFIGNPVMLNESLLYYIKEERNGTSEIFSFDLTTREETQITNDRRLKRNLRIYRANNHPR